MTTPLKPVNNHLLIEPVKNEAFMASTIDTYQEIGVVIDVAPELTSAIAPVLVRKNIIGARVYFDSWLAAKFPKEGTTDEFYWLVKWEDVRAIEHTYPESGNLLLSKVDSQWDKATKNAE